MTNFEIAIRNLQEEAEKTVRENVLLRSQLTQQQMHKEQFEKISHENKILEQKLKQLEMSEALNGVDRKKFTEYKLKEIDETLIDWSQSIFDYGWDDMNRSDCCDRSYYERTKEQLRSEDRKRSEFISNLINALSEE